MAYVGVRGKNPFKAVTWENNYKYITDIICGQFMGSKWLTIYFRYCFCVAKENKDIQFPDQDLK